MTHALVELSLQAAVVLAIGAGAAWSCRLRSAAVRHWILVATVGGALLLPAVRVVWPFTIWPAWPSVSQATTPHLSDVTNRSATADSLSSVDAVEGATAAATAQASGVRRWPSLAGALVGVWVAGALLVLSRLAWGLRTLRRLAATAQLVDDNAWREASDMARRRLGIAAPVRLLMADDTRAVVTWGWRRPTVLLPTSALAWSRDRREVVLAHELSHIARADWLSFLGAEAVCALHWYQPLAWWACRRLRHEAERAADDIVLGAGVDAVSYADHLLDLARPSRSTSAPWPAPAMASPSSLEGRVRAMLDTTIDRGPVSRSTRALVSAVGVVAVCGAASIGAQAQFHTFRGSVVDATSRVVPNVALVLTHVTTSAKHEVRTDANGRFEFVGLPAAAYNLTVTAIGFRPLSDAVTVANDTEQTVRLAVGTLRETVTVTPSDPVAASGRSAKDEAVRQRASERQARALATCAAAPPTSVGGNILPPIKFVHVSPAYPAGLPGGSGSVTMRAIIDREGVVRDVTDVVAPQPGLEAAAVDAVRQWRFTPTLLNCEAIEVEMTVTVNFTAPR